MICYFDTDITLKLAACDLLEQVLAILEVDRDEVYVFKEEALRTYQYDPDVRSQYSEEIRKRAISFAKSCRSVYSGIDPEEQNYMQAAEIDTGEQAIFGATLESAEFRVLTADRKALRKLAIAPGCGGICARMNGRTLSFDQILLMLMLKFGYENIQPQIEPYTECDIALKEAFASSISAVQAEIKLRTRINILRTETLGLLGPDLASA